jgi:chromosome segregation ATPase
VLQESSTSAPTAEQLTILTTERDDLKSHLSAAQDSTKKSQGELKALQDTHTALEKDTKTTHDTLVNIRNEHAKLKETHSSEVQKARLSHSRGAELQLENKTLISRVEELKQKVVSLTSEKVELVERTDSLDKELFKLRKNLDSAVAGGGRGSVELNTELDALIHGHETRRTIRETNQRRYSQFVGEKIVEGDGETMREINEQRLKKGKESGEYGRERETGFVVDLVSARGGCGMCVGEVLVL